MNDKVYSMISLAQKAGELVSGDEVCEMTIKSKKCFLVIIAKNASDRTKKKFMDMCEFRNIKLMEYGQKEGLGNCIGKDIRSVVAIKNANFAKKIEELILKSNELYGGGVIAKEST